jgi:hypothetical protein
MLKVTKKSDEKFNLYKLCNCSCNKKKNNQTAEKKKGNSYEAIRENVAHELPVEKYRK